MLPVVEHGRWSPFLRLKSDKYSGRTFRVPRSVQALSDRGGHRRTNHCKQLRIAASPLELDDVSTVTPKRLSRWNVCFQCSRGTEYKRPFYRVTKLKLCRGEVLRTLVANLRIDERHAVTQKQ